MKIEVKYPLILKMQITTRHSIEDSTTLDQLKGKILDQVWSVYFKTNPDGYEKHGKIEEIQLSFEGKVISSDTDFTANLAPGRVFEAEFTKRGQPL